MLKNQKQRCKEPAIAYMLSAEKRQSQSRPRKREIIEELTARKVRVIKTRSDNNHERKTIEQKKLKSVNLIPKEEIVIQQPFDEYQLNTQDYHFYQADKDSQYRNKYNQCLRSDNSSSKHQDIVSHYRQSKSRYKYAKQKAKRLIQKMIVTSKTNSQQISNQLKNRINDIKTEVTNDKFSSNQYCLTIKTPQKTSTVSNSSHFRPKTDKCSTLNFGSRLKSPLGVRLMTSSSSKRNQLSSSKISMNLNSPVKMNKKVTEDQKNTTQESAEKLPSTQKKLPSQKSINTVITSESGDYNENPLVLKGKHLFTEYGFDQYTKIRTQKQIIQETQRAVKQVSKQISLSRKQTQKLITRARQKNKKIIGKLKQMRQKRSSMRNSQSIKNDLAKSVSRFSKLPGQALRSNLRNSLFQSRQENIRLSYSMQSNEDNFLGLNSNIQSIQAAGFNEQIKQKILIHLETIKTIADYAQSFTKIYQDCNEWEDLIFLLYKKYYIERYKIYQILKTSEVKFHDGSIFKQTPFDFQFCSVSMQEIEVFRESKEQISVELQLQTSNTEVRTALRDLYNIFIQKTADNPSMNMYEVDDFSESILQDLNEEINMLVESCGKSQKIKRRINEAIQVGLMIAHIQGYTFDQIQQIVVGELDGREYFDKFYSKFLQIFED